VTTIYFNLSKRKIKKAHGPVKKKNHFSQGPQAQIKIPKQYSRPAMEPEAHLVDHSYKGRQPLLP
jgi:hypothetical protein